jgi:hypothetical protein
LGIDITSCWGRCKTDFRSQSGHKCSKFKALLYQKVLNKHILFACRATDGKSDDLEKLILESTIALSPPASSWHR